MKTPANPKNLQWGRCQSPGTETDADESKQREKDSFVNQQFSRSVKEEYWQSRYLQNHRSNKICFQRTKFKRATSLLLLAYETIWSGAFWPTKQFEVGPCCPGWPLCGCLRSGGAGVVCSSTPSLSHQQETCFCLFHLFVLFHLKTNMGPHLTFSCGSS